MSAVRVPYCSPEEYLARERISAEKSEYIAGEVFAMSGASFDHNMITLNVGGELRAQLRGQRCSAATSDLRIQAGENGAFFYPDVVVVCGEPIFSADGKPDTVRNPTVLVEVLSPSTSAFDRGLKFAWYRRIESLQEYVMVSQTERLVERYTRRGSDWIFTEFASVDAEVTLFSIGCTLRLADVYDRIEFDQKAATDRTD